MALPLNRAATVSTVCGSTSEISKEAGSGLPVRPVEDLRVVLEILLQAVESVPALLTKTELLTSAQPRIWVCMASIWSCVGSGSVLR